MTAILDLENAPMLECVGGPLCGQMRPSPPGGTTTVGAQGVYRQKEVPSKTKVDAGGRQLMRTVLWWNQAQV